MISVISYGKKSYRPYLQLYVDGGLRQWYKELAATKGVNFSRLIEAALFVYRDLYVNGNSIALDKCNNLHIISD